MTQVDRVRIAGNAGHRIEPAAHDRWTDDAPLDSAPKSAGETVAVGRVLRRIRGTVVSFAAGSRQPATIKQRASANGRYSPAGFSYRFVGDLGDERKRRAQPAAGILQHRPFRSSVPCRAARSKAQAPCRRYRNLRRRDRTGRTRARDRLRSCRDRDPRRLTVARPFTLSTVTSTAPPVVYLSAFSISALSGVDDLAWINSSVALAVRRSTTRAYPPSAKRGDHIFGQVGDIHREHRMLAMFEPRQHDQIVDDRLHPAALRKHVAKHRLSRAASWLAAR